MSEMENGIIAEGVPAEKGKFCADCKHLIGVRYMVDEWDKWRCGHKNNIVSEKVNLVTGIKRKLFIREDLSYLRMTNTADVCGPEGKWYELYEKPDFYEAPPEKPAPKKKGIDPESLGM